MKKSSRAITLIALIITIIILLIITVITINIILSENGILTKAQFAKKVHTDVQNNENNVLMNYEMEIGNLNNSRYSKEEVEKYMEEYIKDNMGKYVQEEVDKQLSEKHNRITHSVFSINYGSGSSTWGAATRRMSSFTNSKASDFSNYFVYDTQNNNLVCTKEGWYILNLSYRAYAYENGSIYARLIINGLTIESVDTYIQSSSREGQAIERVNMYLFEGDTVDFALLNGATTQYNSLVFQIYPN